MDELNDVNAQLIEALDKANNINEVRLRDLVVLKEEKSDIQVKMTQVQAKMKNQSEGTSEAD